MVLPWSSQGFPSFFRPVSRVAELHGALGPPPEVRRLRPRAAAAGARAAAAGPWGWALGTAQNMVNNG